MADPLVLRVAHLSTPWQTLDPFLFCMHHDDRYPAGNADMGPAAPLDGRDIGQDFGRKDGWSMYHGDVIPGFPRHPHRGFETVTLARAGYIDHSDSLGATARFGHGDAQWMTAGKGVVHAEMFPLVKTDAGNPTELFQVWLNLPQSDKMVEPYFTMLWSERIPRHTFRDEKGGVTEVVTVAGALEGVAAPPPPPNSWASRDSTLAIWTIRLSPGARWTLPPSEGGVNRVLYYFIGKTLMIGDRKVEPGVAIQLTPTLEAELLNGAEESELLLLQGRPIGEPVAKYGPFVMNTTEEIYKAYEDYRATGFGGWPWRHDGPVHAREDGRFAIHADGRKERPA